MRAATPDPTAGATGRGPGCNMESPIKGDKEVRVHTAGTGLPAAGALPTRGEAVQEGKGAPAGSGAGEDYPATAKPRGAGKKVQDRLSPAPPPPALDSRAAAEAKGAKWSPGRRNIVRGPELWRLLKEQLKDPDWPAF